MKAHSDQDFQAGNSVVVVVEVVDLPRRGERYPKEHGLVVITTRPVGHLARTRWRWLYRRDGDDGDK